MDNVAVKESMAVFETSQGVEIRASLLRFTRHSAFLEIYSPANVVQTSEVLSEFRIICNDRILYSGRAVVRNLLHTGLVTVCEAILDDAWVDLELVKAISSPNQLGAQFNLFMAEWQKFYRVLPEFKAVIADFQTFLTDLRLWLEQIELSIRSSPSADRLELERQIVTALSEQVVRALDAFVERFEAIAAGLPEEIQPAHRVYLRRMLHPLVLCSPFAYRTFHKPLGYAGDYEMVNMMLRPPYEGSTLFAKIMNVWLLGQAPVVAHRNRIADLTKKLVQETMRVHAKGRVARVFNLGCGPADEIQQFLKEHPLSEQASFYLLDFNDETLRFLQSRLEDIRQRNNRSTPVQLVKKSVHQVLKEGGRSLERGAAVQYDFVYCAGLFDYLTSQVCKRLMNIFYNLLAPGGLLVATNVSDTMNSSRPFRYSMEYILEWNLIYRNGRQVAELAPDAAPPENVAVINETTGVNTFIEVRKPDA